MEKIEYKSKTVEIPSVLDELNNSQYQAFLMLAVMMRQGIITPAQFRVKFLSSLLGMKTDYTVYREDVIHQLDGQLHKLDGFFSYRDGENNERIVSPVLSTGRNLMPDFGGWHGVGDMLNGMTFGDFCECLELYQQYKNEPDTTESERILEEITLKLYQFTGTDKCPDVPSLLVIHAVTLFSTVWTMILAQPICINGEDIDFRILFKKSTAGAIPDDKTGWTGIAFEVAASGVFGNVKEVNNSPLWDVLLYLYKCKFEYLHQKK